MPDLKKIIVVKRDGKKVAFDRAKIALAIKKGFDSVKLESGENKYTEKDINNTFNKVLQKIEELNPERLKIEEIQDLIEDALREGYEDVYEFSPTLSGLFSMSSSDHSISDIVKAFKLILEKEPICSSL